MTTAELSLTANTDTTSLLGQAGVLSTDTDALYVTDNQFGQIHVSSLACASILVQNGIDAIMQLSCRHRNRIALVSDLLAARQLGITSVVLVRGNKVPDDLKPRPKSVLDISAKELIATASLIGKDEPREQPDEFLIGAVATAFNPAPAWQPKELLAKADAGARFVLTQACFDLDVVRRYVARLVAAKLTHRVHIIAGIGPIPSAETARFLQQNQGNALIPDWLVKRLEQAADPEQEGVAICAELLQELSEIPGVSGANLMTYGEPETIAAALQSAGVRG